MHPSAAPLAATVALNTDLLLNALDGMDQETACRQLAEGTNSAAFLALHLIDARHFLASELGTPLENPFAELAAARSSIADFDTLPPLDELRAAWHRIGNHLVKVIGALTADQLAVPSERKFPIGDRTLLGVLTFLVQHDSYHLGQVALLRRQLGLPAMAYTRS